MSFKQRFNLEDLSIPGRLYVHESGLELFGKGDEALNYIRDYAVQTLRAQNRSLSNFDFFLASSWGDSSRRMKFIDVFGYKLENGVWKSNADVYSAVVRNGSWREGDNPFSCEDVLIMLGREAELRRASSDLVEYMAKKPLGIPGLDI